MEYLKNKDFQDLCRYTKEDQFKIQMYENFLLDKKNENKSFIEAYEKAVLEYASKEVDYILKTISKYPEELKTQIIKNDKLGFIAKNNVVEGIELLEKDLIKRFGQKVYDERLSIKNESFMTNLSYLKAYYNFNKLPNSKKLKSSIDANDLEIKKMKDRYTNLLRDAVKKSKDKTYDYSFAVTTIYERLAEMKKEINKKENMSKALELFKGKIEKAEIAQIMGISNLNNLKTNKKSNLMMAIK